MIANVDELENRILGKNRRAMDDYSGCSAEMSARQALRDLLKHIEQDSSYRVSAKGALNRAKMEVSAALGLDEVSLRAAKDVCLDYFVSRIDSLEQDLANYRDKAADERRQVLDHGKSRADAQKMCYSILEEMAKYNLLKSEGQKAIDALKIEREEKKNTPEGVVANELLAGYETRMVAWSLALTQITTDCDKYNNLYISATSFLGAAICAHWRYDAQAKLTEGTLRFYRDAHRMFSCVSPTDIIIDSSRIQKYAQLSRQIDATVDDLYGSLASAVSQSHGSQEKVSELFDKCNKTLNERVGAILCAAGRN